MRPAIAIAALAVACTSVQVDRLDVPSAQPDYFFYVVFDAAGMPARLSAVYGVDGGKVVSGGDPLLKLEDGESRAAAVALTKEELTALHGGFLPEQTERITVALAEPPDAPITFDDHALAALPNTAQIFGATIEEVSPAITLSLPVEPEWCKPSHGTAMRPFGATAELLPPSVVIDGEGDQLDDRFRRLVSVHKLDGDRVLAASQWLIFIVHRGEAFGAHVFRVDRAQPETIEINSLYLGSADANGVRPMIAGGKQGAYPAVFELELEGDDVRFVRTATIVRVETGNPFIHDAIVDRRGDTIAVGDGGTAIIRRRGESQFVARAPLSKRTGAEYVFWRIIDTGDANAPHLLTENDGRLMLGDMASDAWQTFERGDRLDNRRFYGLAVAPGGGEYWAAGVKGSVFANAGAGWEKLDLFVPPSFTPCATPTPEGRRAFTSTLRAVALDAEAGYLAFSDCNVVLRVTREEHCVSVLSSDGAPAMPTHLDWQAIEVADGEMIVGGSNGLLFSISSP